MNERSFYKGRIYFTLFITLAIWSLLVFYLYRGGVPGHHILANDDLPEISNWWGGLLLPLVAWFLSYLTQKRIFSHHDGTRDSSKQIRNALFGFLGSLIYGILVATSFAFENTDITGNMMLALLPMALFIPIYRAECILGFVIGMTFTFGAVLPTGIACLFAAAGFVIYRYIRQGIVYTASRIGIGTSK
jgi:ABC-type polysaccharide/polyol phosphate export permease